LQNNVTNSTPLQPLNGDGPAPPSAAVDSVPINPGSRKRASDTTIENSRKKIRRGEENLNKVCGEVDV
jgi:hypothetical protein